MKVNTQTAHVALLNKVLLASSIVAINLAAMPAAAQGTAPPGDAAPPVTPTEPVTPPEEVSTPSVAATPQPTRRPYRAGPAINFYTPSAYGRSKGSVGLGVLYQAETRRGPEQDGAIGLSIGLGNPRRLGFDVGVNVLSLTDNDSAAFRRGSFNFKVHHRLRNNSAVAVGTRNIFIWGGSDNPSSTYAVFSTARALKKDYRASFSRLYASIGVSHNFVGSGHAPFRESAEENLELWGKNNIFGSVALKVSEPVNIFTEWTGAEWVVGASFVPFRRVPLTVTPALVDITHRTTDSTRFNLALGYGLKF